MPKEYTAQQIQEMKEWECGQRGHDFETIVVVGSNDPVAVVCGRCGASFSIENVLPRVAQCVIGSDNDRRVYVCMTHGLLDPDDLTIHHDCCHCGQRAIRFDIAHDQRLAIGEN